jgi:hypothetical protein
MGSFVTMFVRFYKVMVMSGVTSVVSSEYFRRKLTNIRTNSSKKVSEESKYPFLEDLETRQKSQIAPLPKISCINFYPKLFRLGNSG